MLYAFGSNGRHQLGLGSHNEDVSDPECLKFFQNISISMVASGGNHTLFLSDTGDLYGAGSNQSHELGINSKSGEIVKPQLIPGKYKLICCGWQFSLALGRDGYVYSTGSGQKGELGLGKDITEVAQFTRLDRIGDGTASIIQMDAGLNHAVVVLSDGSAYGWGTSRKGQLGPLLTPEKQLNRPHKIQCTEKITDAACGREYTVLGNRYTGYVEVFGPDRLAVKSNKPTLHSGEFQTLKSGWSSIHILTTNNRIISWGNNSHGQCSANNLEAVDIAIGSEHGLAVDRSGGIYAWGWGEHGNCGVQGKQQPGPWKLETLKNHKIRSIFAGHANSWIQYQ